MKYFPKFAKLILYMILGGLMAFVCIFVSSYMKASGIAGDISRNALLLATQEGCINNDTALKFCENMTESYGTKNLLIANRIKNPENSDEEDYKVHMATTSYSGVWEPKGAIAQGLTNYGLLSCKSSDGTNLINESGKDYYNHVQRGETITVNTTVEVFIHINTLFGKGQEKETDPVYQLTMTFPVNAEATGISCKWFKGEEDGV